MMQEQKRGNFSINAYIADELTKLMPREIAKWGAIVRDRKITAE